MGRKAILRRRAVVLGMFMIFVALMLIISSSVMYGYNTTTCTEIARGSQADASEAPGYNTTISAEIGAVEGPTVNCVNFTVNPRSYYNYSISTNLSSNSSTFPYLRINGSVNEEPLIIHVMDERSFAIWRDGGKQYVIMRIGMQKWQDGTYILGDPRTSKPPNTMQLILVFDNHNSTNPKVVRLSASVIPESQYRVGPGSSMNATAPNEGA